jgi:hypothetical protein
VTVVVFPGLLKIRDNLKTPVRFPAVNQALIQELCSWKSVYLNEHDVRRPLVESISQRSEELGILNVV